MIRKGMKRKPSAARAASAFDDVVEWVRSLPWVVDRSVHGGSRGVRLFAVDCAPLGRRRLWLVAEPAKNAPDGVDLGAVIPVAASWDAEAAGWKVHRAMPLADDQVLMTLGSDTVHERHGIEAFVLAAYSHAMS